MVDSFVRDLEVMHEDFGKNAPTTIEGRTTADALEFIRATKEAVAGMRTRAAEMKPGMDIFHIPQPLYKELTQMEKELDLLDRMWSVVVEWQASGRALLLCPPFHVETVGTACTACILYLAWVQSGVLYCVAIAPSCHSAVNGGAEC